MTRGLMHWNVDQEKIMQSEAWRDRKDEGQEKRRRDIKT